MYVYFEYAVTFLSIKSKFFDVLWMLW